MRTFIVEFCKCMDYIQHAKMLVSGCEPSSHESANTLAIAIIISVTQVLETSTGWCGPLSMGTACGGFTVTPVYRLAHATAHL